MEHAQRVTAKLEQVDTTSSLNPYFNGTCSKSSVQQITFVCNFVS